MTLFEKIKKLNFMEALAASMAPAVFTLWGNASGLAVLFAVLLSLIFMLTLQFRIKYLDETSSVTFRPIECSFIFALSTLGAITGFNLTLNIYNMFTFGLLSYTTVFLLWITVKEHQQISD